MEGLRIRELTPEDAETVIGYLKRVGGETDNLTFGAEGLPVSAEREAEILAAVQKDPRSVMLGVWRGNGLVANGSLQALPRRMAHRAELGLTVVRDEWNKGIGSMLLEKLIGFAKSAGLEIVNLEVRGDNLRAIRLYEKFGFRKIGTFPSYFRIGDAYYDFELMVLDLRQ